MLAHVTHSVTEALRLLSRMRASPIHMVIGISHGSSAVVAVIQLIKEVFQ